MSARRTSLAGKLCKGYMEIKDVQPNQGNIDVVAVVASKEDERTFEKFGKQGRVCNAKIKDDSGEITLTLWNDDIDKVNVGDKIHLENGWCSEYRDQRQLSAGKFGKIEIVQAASEQKPQEVLTNDPGMLAQQMPEGEQMVEELQEDPEGVPEEDIDEEEIVG